MFRLKYSLPDNQQTDSHAAGTIQNTALVPGCVPKDTANLVSGPQKSCIDNFKNDEALLKADSGAFAVCDVSVTGDSVIQNRPASKPCGFLKSPLEKSQKRILLTTSAAPAESPFATSEKRPPIGLGFLISALRNAGHEVFFIDNYLQPSDFLETGFLQNKIIDYVGIYANTICFRDTLRMLRKIEQLRRTRQWNGKIIIGGPHTKVALDTIPDFVDYVVQGEGEQAIVDIVEGKVSDRLVKYPRIKDLDILPAPAWDYFAKLPYDWKMSFIDEEPVFAMNTSRGCPFSCQFCSVGSIWGRQYTHFSAERIVDDVEHLIRAYGARGIYFREDNFTLNRARLEKFCNFLISKKTNISWVCESRVSNLDADIINLMVRAGLKGFYFGVESGSQRILDLVEKGITVEQTVNAFRLCHEVGIKAAASIIVGVPGETQADIDATEDLLAKIKPDIIWRCIFVGIPDSKLYKHCIDNKLYEYIDDRGLVYPQGYSDRAKKYYSARPSAFIPMDEAYKDMTNRPKISVLMAAYNCERFIGQALDSIYSQTFQDFELVIVDDASTDKTSEIILDKKDSRTVIFRNSQNLGLTKSLNIGIRLCRGEFVARMDADDVSYPERFEKQMRFFESHPDAVVLGCWCDRIDEKGKKIGAYDTMPTEDEPLKQQLLSYNSIAHGTAIVRRDALVKSGGYNEEFKRSQDHDLWLRLSETGKLYNLPEYLYALRTWRSSITTTTFEEQRRYSQLAMQEAMARRSMLPNDKNISSVKLFFKAKEEFASSNFEEAFKNIHQYRTTIDYGDFPRLVKSGKTDDIEVSVVIVTFHRTRDVKNCIESVDKQQTPRSEYEIIVVDNGFTDESTIKPICDQYIKCPVNLGLSEGRNIGAVFTKGKIISFLDDDALVGPDYISSIRKAFAIYDIFGFRGKVLPITDTEANRQAYNYDRGDEPFCTFCDQEGVSAFLTDVYLKMEGMDPLLFGAEGSDLSYRIGKKYKCFNKIIYWPRTVVYHDATTGAAKKARQELYKLNEKYLNLKLGISFSAARREVEKKNLPVRSSAGNEPCVIAQKPKRGSRFSFVMIVLNGMPFIEYSLKSIYDFAHEIIIVEGAVNDCVFAANPDGNSTDGTVEFIKSFPDPGGKIKLIQGKWPEKCEMQNEALKYVTGDYVWLIDSDEIYKGADLERIKNILKDDPSITQVNFLLNNFWKGLDYIFTSQKFYDPRNHCRRVFKYMPGAVFTTHRPPTMTWPRNDKTTEQMKLLDGTATKEMGVVIYHYSYILDKQVKQKIELYQKYGWGKHWGVDLGQWYSECFLKWQPWNREEIDARYPIWTGDKNSHTEPFEGTHPEVMMDFVLKEAAEPSNGRAMEHVIAAIEQLKSRFSSEKISAIETGTIRSFYEKHFSTYHISRSLGDRGRLISVDISEDSLRVSKQLCYRSTNIEFVQSDSIKYLSGLEKQKFHFALLDSVNDKDFIFNEFRLIVPLMVEGGVVIIDDAGISPVNHQVDISLSAQKGHKVWEFVQSCGIKSELLTTPRNHGTQIKIEMTADNIHKINAGLCRASGDIRKVLIVRSDSIGDLVIFGGSFQYYRQLYPGCHITLVVTDAVGNLAQINPYIDEIITFNRTKIAFDQEYAAQFIRQIQAGKYDVTICPAHSRDRVSDFIAMNSGAKERITTSGDTANQTTEQIEHNNKYFTKILPACDGIKLETFRNEEFLRNLGAKIEEEYTPMAWFTKDETDFAASLLEQINVQNPILVAPFAQSVIRDWHIQGWAKLISSHKDIPIVICGLEANRLNADKIIALTDHPNVHNLCGKTSVRQLAALISKSRLCVSPCSAPAHLAAVAGCPHVVLVGGGHFGRFWPYSKLTRMVYKEMDCFGCNWRCKYGKDIKCLKDISFEMVEEAVRSCLGIDSKPAVGQPEEVRSDNRAYQYLVSAIVSTYNSEKFIHGCLEDLERQTIADKLEIIVVNSGSKQNEEAVVKEFQQKHDNIKYIKTQHRETIYQAWNRAIKAASGKYIAVANTDDRRRKDAIEVMANVLEANRDIALVYADQYETSNENETFENITVGKKNIYPDFEQDVFLDLGWCNMGSQPMWRAEIHKEIGDFDGNFEIAGDYDFLLRVCEKYRCFHVPQVLGTFYRSAGKTVSCSNRFRLSVVENPLAKARSLVRKGIKCIEKEAYHLGIEYLQKSLQCWPSREAVEHIQIVEEKTSQRTGANTDIRFDYLSSVWDWPKEMSAVSKARTVDREFNDANSCKYLLSVVIAGCKSVEEIKSCLEQLAAQNIAAGIEAQLIVEQTPQYYEVPEKYEHKFANLAYVKIDRGENIWSGVNRALKSSAGRFVTILKPGYKYSYSGFEKMVRTLEQDISEAAVYTSAIRSGGICENNIKPEELFDEDFNAGRLMWRRCLHEKYGWFDESFFITAEYEFWCRVAQDYCFARASDILEDCPRQDIEYDLDLGFENGLIKKVYQYAKLCSIHVDSDGISNHAIFSRWFEVNILKKRTWEKLHNRKYDPIRNIEDRRRSSISPSLSIIIVTHDRDKALAQSLEALSQQSESNFEVIIVNNGSSTLDEAAHNNLDVCWIELDNNYGPSFARNVGAAHSRAQYIAFLDDDAVADCDFVKNVIRHFEADNIISLRGRILSPCGGYVPDMYDLGDEAIPYAADMEGNCAFRKDVYVQAGGFSEWQFHGEGIDLSYRIFKSTGEDVDCMFYFPDVVIYHQPYGNQLYRLERVVRADFMEKLMKEKNPGIERYLDYMFNFYPVNRKDIENKLGRMFNNASFLLDKKPDRALEWAKMARKNFPDALGPRFILGSAYFKLGDLEKARDELHSLFLVIEEILAQKTEQSRDILAEKKESIADMFLQTVSRLSQCCSRLGDYNMVKSVYERALQNTQVGIPSGQRSSMKALLQKLNSMPLSQIPAVSLEESISVSPAIPQKEYLVSAIVSTYNAEEFIRGCLEDLENQTIADRLEIIVVNSGSQQNEEAIVREFQEKYDNIVYIKTEQKEGVYSAWNRAIKAARGRFLTNANTDDRHRRDALEILSNELINNPEIALVYSDQICTETPNATFEKHHAVETHPQPDYSRERLLLGCCVGSQPMWRGSLHEELGYFDETLDCAADWDFWLRASEKYNFKRIPEFLGLYYFNREGIEHGNMFHSYYERYVVGRRYGTEYISTLNTYETKRNWLVSVILPAYNAEEYISQAIESVLIQNYRHFELVIINDGSTDRTEQIIHSYKDEHIRYFKQANRGLAATHNAGIRQSRGEFLIKVDADDFIAVDFIGRHLNEFYNHRDADLVYCDDYLVEEDGKPIRIIERPEYADRRILIRDLFRAGFPVVPFRTCIRKHVFDKIGLFDETLRIGEDYDMMKRFVKAGLKAQHLKAALYYRRMTSESLSRQYSINKARAHFGIVKSYAETFSHDELFPGVKWELIPSVMRQLHFKCLVAMNFISLGRTYIETNLPSYARAALESAGEQLSNCLEIDPGNDSVKKLIDRCRQLEENLPQDVLMNI